MKMNPRHFDKIIITLLFLFNFLKVINSTKERFKNSNNQSRNEETRFIQCLENNSLTSCLILLFINERQEKLLLQVQNELSK